MGLFRERKPGEEHALALDKKETYLNELNEAGSQTVCLALWFPCGCLPAYRWSIYLHVAFKEPWLPPLMFPGVIWRLQVLKLMQVVASGFSGTDGSMGWQAESFSWAGKEWRTNLRIHLVFLSQWFFETSPSSKQKSQEPIQSLCKTQSPPFLRHLSSYYFYLYIFPQSIIFRSENGRKAFKVSSG